MINNITVNYANSLDFQQIITLEELLKKIPENMQSRALRYRFPQDAYNYVLGRLLLKKGLLDNDVPVKNLERVYYNEMQKPLIDGLSFNISHSKHLVACAYSINGNIGLDIEFPRLIKKENFRNCFNALEWQYITFDDSLHTFYTYWTQKEAILKANGAGLGSLLDMDIINHQYAYFGKERKPETSKKWYLRSLKLDNEEAYACLCAEREVEVTVNKIEFIE